MGELEPRPGEQRQGSAKQTFAENKGLIAAAGGVVVGIVVVALWIIAFHPKSSASVAGTSGGAMASVVKSGLMAGVFAGVVTAGALIRALGVRQNALMRLFASWFGQ